ncbi:MAG: hypothetical protein FGM32_04300 [Candidatus Kapabacteria bacterium]|nr:hypothetical protein [Candidatus Kapabacteria bacterium]
MKRVLIALALLACIGSSVMAQTYRPLTGTKLLLNSTYPSGGSLTLQANPGSDYTLTLPSTAPAANTVLIGSTSGSFDWFTFSNGLSPSESKTIELGGTLTKNTTIDIGTKVFQITSSNGGTMNINANLNVNATDGAIELTSPTQAVNLTAATSVSIGNPSSSSERGEIYVDKDAIELRITDGVSKGFIGIGYISPDASITLEAAQIDVGGNVVPVTHDAHSLGSTTNRWKDVFIGPSSLHIGTGVGTAELLVGYNSGTNTAYFNIDNSSSIFTINKTSGLATTSALTVGNGDATDIITVNTIAGNNLTISEDEIKRNAVLKFQGSDGTNTTQFTLNDDANLNSSQGDIFLNAPNGGLTFEAGAQINLSTVQGSQNSTLLMSPTTSTELKMQDGTVNWSGSIQISQVTNAVETQTTLGAVTASSYLDAANNLAVLKALDGSGESAVTITGGTNGNVVLKTVSTDRMTVASDGAVGIGTSSPSQRLHISGGNVRIDPASVGVAGQLQLRNPANTFSTNIQAGAQSANITYTLPTTAPSAGQMLSSATDGTLSWATGLTTSTGWSLSGNTGYTASGSLGGAPTGSILGSTTGLPLNIVTNNAIRMAFASDGAIQMGSGAVSINADQNFATNINTGTSTGAVSIGNTGSSIAMLGTTTINSTGTASTTIGNVNMGRVLTLNGGAGGVNIIRFVRTVGATLTYGWGLSGGQMSFNNETEGKTTMQTGWVGGRSQVTVGFDYGSTSLDPGDAGMLKGSDAGVLGTNTKGGDLTIASGRGRGNGTPTTITFQTPVTVGSGSAVQTYSTRMAITSDGHVQVNSLNGAAKSSIGSNDRVVIATSTGSLDQASFSTVVSQGAWTLTGNSGTSGSNFLGTTDAKPLSFRTDNVERVRISSDGNVEATSNLLPTTSNNYQVGFDASRWKDVWIGSGAATGLHIGSTNGSAELRVAYSSGTGTFNVDGTSLLTMGATDGVIVTGPLSASGGAVNLNNNSNNVVNIGTGTSTGTVTVGGSAAQTIDIGTGAAAKTVSLGSTNTTSTTTLNSGSGGVKVNVDNNQPTNINTGTSTGAVSIGNSGSSLTVLGPTTINSTGSANTTIGSSDGNVGIGVTSPTALLHVGAGTASKAAMKLSAGVVLTSAEANAVEWDGTDLNITTSAPTRHRVNKGLTAQATLDFDLTGAQCHSILVTVTGAAVGDVVSLGVPDAAVANGTIIFTAWVSAADIVTVRCCDLANTGADPASADFKVFVTK